MTNRIRTIFFGTPEFAARYFSDLLDDGRFEVVAAVTQPDRPAGRGKEIAVSAVKSLAISHGVPTLQPENLKTDNSIISELKGLAADLFVVVAYGQIIPKVVLDIPKHGAINVHPSLLPKYRGASPIQSALLNGDQKTGVSIMLMDEKMDHGPILSQLEIPFAGDETNVSLHEKVADVSARLLLDTAYGFVNGEVKPVEQDHAQATFCKLVTREDAKIDWNKSATEIKNQVDAFYPWPGTWTTLDGKRLKIFPPVTAIEMNGEPGNVIVENDGITVSCGSGSLKLSELQIEGKKRMTPKEFLQGHNDLPGKVLGAN